MATTSTTTAGFALGISAEDKLSMPLDDLIKKSKAVSKANKPKAAANANANAKPAAGAAKKKAGEKTKKKPAAAAAPAASKKKSKKLTRQQTNVKKTVTVPVSKAARARANTKASSTKRQEVINKRRPGLVMAKPTQTKREVPVQVRLQKTSMLRVARKAAPMTAVGKKRQQTQQKKQNNTGATLDVSNIQRHFASHPSKFDLPKGTNLRITINLNKVKPVVGAKK